MINPMNLNGRHVVVTGASAGIGRSVAIQASKLGAKVSLIARNEERLKETLEMLEGGGHQTFSFDLMNVSEIEPLLKKIVEQNGPIDGLVHCAGLGGNRPIKFTKPALMEDMMRIHCFAFTELMRVASQKQNSNEGASYVGVSSVASVHGNKAQGAYAAAKNAMNGIIHPFAKELAAKSIRVNTIAFGMVDTEMYRRDFLEAGGNNEELLREQILGVIPVEYAGNAVCFLLSDTAKYITGSMFQYDAGALS